jgi:hypothetical protein
MYWKKQFDYGKVCSPAYLILNITHILKKLILILIFYLGRDASSLHSLFADSGCFIIAKKMYRRGQIAQAFNEQFKEYKEMYHIFYYSLYVLSMTLVL